jgi:hypothetical protein
LAHVILTHVTVGGSAAPEGSGGRIAARGPLVVTAVTIANNRSDAMDALPAARCPSTDQRGVAGPSGSACDIGAYEFEDVPDGRGP